MMDAKYTRKNRYEQLQENCHNSIEEIRDYYRFRKYSGCLATEKTS